MKGRVRVLKNGVKVNRENKKLKMHPPQKKKIHSILLLLSSCSMSSPVYLRLSGLSAHLPAVL